MDNISIDLQEKVQGTFSPLSLIDTAMYLTSAVQFCITKKSTTEKVGSTKHRTSPSLQKVGGTCPPVYPRIYAHADIGL